MLQRIGSGRRLLQALLIGGRLVVSALALLVSSDLGLAASQASTVWLTSEHQWRYFQEGSRS